MVDTEAPRFFVVLEGLGGSRSKGSGCTPASRARPPPIKYALFSIVYCSGNIS